MPGDFYSSMGVASGMNGLTTLFVLHINYVPFNCLPPLSDTVLLDFTLMPDVFLLVSGSRFGDEWVNNT